MIRDIVVRKPESAPVLKQKFYQNVEIHEVYLEAVPVALILATMLNNGKYAHYIIIYETSLLNFLFVCRL